MITNITINNVILIEKLHIEFQEGLCALTGETGAGKSILLDSVGLIQGGRGSESLIGKNSDQCSVSVSFNLDEDHPANKIIKDLDIENDGDLIIKRIINKDGKNKSFINDQPVSMSTLKSIGETLIEIHGQFDNYKLLSPSLHGKMLDEYARLRDKLYKLSKIWKEWKTTEKLLNEAQDKIEKLKEEEEYLIHVIKELEELAPEEGEEEALSEIKIKLQNKERILEALNNGYSCITGDKSADDMLQKAYRIIDRGTQNAGNDVNPALEAIDKALDEVNNAISIIDNIFADMRDEDTNLQYTDDRLYALKSSARKHQCLVDDLPKKLDELKDQLEFIRNQDDLISDLMIKSDKEKKKYINLSEDISKIRHKSGKTIDKEVMLELKPLKLEKARFRTSISVKDGKHWNENGIDDVIFEVSTNPNSDFGAINKVASGGEMARFMLALKVVLAETGDAETLIFDEVDTGIGGAVAMAVGERLRKLGRSKQILVVTHSPQVASQANNHWHITKSSNENAKTVTSVTTLNDKIERTNEIARMLAGSTITSEAIAAAEKLLQSA